MPFVKIEEENYTLGTDQSDIATAKCHFCMKTMDNYQLIGPFTKQKEEIEMLQITEDQI